MSKIILVGDLHFRDKKLTDISSAWSRLIAFARKNSVGLIAQAGDVFDHVNVHGKEATVGTVYDAFLEPFRSSMLSQPRVLVIPGNHDIGPAMEKDALAPLEGHPCLTVCRRPDVINPLPDVSVCAVPWINKANLAARLMAKGASAEEARSKAESALSEMFLVLRAKIESAKKDGRFVVLLAHVEVTGASLGRNRVQANGPFEFSPLALSSLGADAYALGHIHVRQSIPGLPGKEDGYLGTLCQLGFGEEDNDVGFRLMEVANGKATSDRWVPNKISPRYKTVSVLDDIQYRPGIDYIKVRSEVKPENLPEGVIFEKLPTAQAQRAPARYLDCDTPLGELLAAWKENSRSEMDLGAMAEAAGGLASTLPAPKDSIGSLDRINNISLTNITCHPSLEVDLSRLRGICGIDGPNGSGKTTLVESILAGLFGFSPNRTIQELASQEATGDSIIEVGFESGSRRYQVRREFRAGKAPLHKAFLFEGENQVAGPKVDDVAAACENLVGDPGMFMAGTFSSQGQAGNLVELRPAERKELFAKLLGTHKFLALAETAKAACQGGQANIQAKKSRAEQLRAEVIPGDQVKQAMDKANEAIAHSRAEMADKQSKLEAVRSELAVVEAARKARDEAIARHQELQRKMEQVREQGKALKSQREALAAMDVREAEAAAKEATGAKDELALARARAAEAETRRAALAQKASQLESQAERLLAERDKEYSEKLLQHAQDAEKLKKGREKSRAVVQEQIQQVNVKIESAKVRLEQAERQVKALEGFPDEKACEECPLAKDGLQARSDAAEARKTIKRLSEGKERSEGQLAEMDVETSRMLERLTAQVPGKDDWMPNKAAEAHHLGGQALQARKDVPPPDPHLDSLIIALEEKASLLPALEARLSKAREQQVQLSALDAQLAEKRARFDEIKKEVAAFKVPDAPNDSPLLALARDLAKTLADVQAAMDKGNRMLGLAQAAAKANKDKEEELSSLEAEITKEAKSTEVMSALAKAFGRDGVPQMIVEGAIPRFQDVMMGLLQEFDGRWAIQVSSQRLTKAGSAQEVIDILVDSGHGPRDISTFSGGEKTILKTIIRIAFATLQAERTGKGLKVLVLDEATDAVDDDNSETVIRMLSRLSVFNQVLVVSHKSRVLSSLPNRITLPGNGEKPRVFIGGEAM